MGETSLPATQTLTLLIRVNYQPGSASKAQSFPHVSPARLPPCAVSSVPAEGDHQGAPPRYNPPASREANYKPVNKPVSSGKARSFPDLPWLPEHAWPVASLVQMPIKGEVRTLCPKLGFRASTGHSHDSVCTFLFTPCPFGSLRSHSLELYLPWKEMQKGSPPKTLQFCRQVCKL